MRTHIGPLRRSGPFLRPRTTVAAISTAALALVSLGTLPGTATSAPDASCPAPFPVPEVAAGQQVHGLTVSKGTTPEPFTGEILGVIDDGIAPDLDMVIARLTSPEIDRVHGIWQGMSGSPVYAADGRLVGAVAYGLSFGSSPVAGITPAADMQELLSATPGTARTTARLGQQDGKVSVPRRLQQRLAATAGTSAREAASGLTRLPLPLGISGMISAKRLRQATKALGLEDIRAYKAGAVSASTPETEIVAGGNLAASLSYGDLSAIGVGTATAVCGEEVLAFGHPMNFTGPSKLTMHGADAVFIQEESLGAPFKVANPSAPVGSILQDRLAGLLGVTGVIPATSDVTSFVEVPGETKASGAPNQRTGTTHISVPEAVPDLAPFHMLVDQDRVFDGFGGGRAEVSWTVTGERAGGETFSFTRHDRFANSFDISFEPVIDLANQLFQLQFNDFEKVTIKSVKTSSSMHRDFASYNLKRVQVRQHGVWRNLSQRRPLVVRPGTTKRFRVLLTSPDLGDKTVPVSLPIPPRAGGKSGFIEFAGGNSFFSFEDEFEGGGSSVKSFDGLIQKLKREPRNDQVLANLTFFKRGADLKRSRREQAGAVVDGGFAVELVAIPRRRR